MAFPTVQYDATNGSDTAPTGNDGSGTNGDIATSTLTLNETVDFTGVADDDSDYLWFNGNAGDRHLFQITAFNPSVGACTSLTLAETATATRTGSNWAVNGERKTLKNDTSNYDWNDCSPGWSFEFQEGTYDVDVMIDTAGDAVDGLITYKAASGATATLRSTMNDEHFADLSYVELRGLTFTTNASPKTATCLARSNADVLRGKIKDCVIDGLQNGLMGYWYFDVLCTGTTWKNMVSNVLAKASYGCPGTFIDCTFIDNGGWVIEAINSSGARDRTTTFLRCIIHNNTSGGIQIQNSIGLIQHCVIDGNGGDGIQTLDGLTDGIALTITNNVITNNSGYGINCESKPKRMYFIDSNAYKSNTSGDHNNCEEDASNGVTLSADPYTDLANDVFTLNNTVDGGALCRNAGINGFDIGTHQHAATPPIPHPLYGS